MSLYIADKHDFAKMVNIVCDIGTSIENVPTNYIPGSSCIIPGEQPKRYILSASKTWEEDV